MDKGTLAPSTVFWRLAALTSISPSLLSAWHPLKFAFIIPFFRKTFKLSENFPIPICEILVELCENIPTRYARKKTGRCHDLGIDPGHRPQGQKPSANHWQQLPVFLKKPFNHLKSSALVKIQILLQKQQNPQQHWILLVPELNFAYLAGTSIHIGWLWFPKGT